MVRGCVALGALGVLLMGFTATAQPPGTPPGGFPGGPPGGFPGGFPGPFTPPQPGQVLSGPLQEQLKLTAEQKKLLAELQKDVDRQLAEILTTEQHKNLQSMRAGTVGFGMAGFGKGGFGPPGFGPPGGPGGPPGGFGGTGANRLDDVKKQLGATDEEWKVISTKLQKVISARQVLNSDPRSAGPFVGFGGPATNVIAQAQSELKTVLDDPKHTRAEMEQHVQAVRKARQKARADLDAAQKDLLPLLTASQEAMLVSLGYLD
jgi:Spy/CpxP family protein refolding chaperone